MTYTEAKEAIEQEGIAENSGHWFNNIAPGGSFLFNTWDIDMALITAPGMWGKIRDTMQRDGLTNEQALRRLGLIDRSDLEVLLFANFDYADQTQVITLKDFQDQKKVR